MSVKEHIIKSATGTRTVRNLTPIKACRLLCIECMGFQLSLVEGCTATTCPLHPFRLGIAHKNSPGGPAQGENGLKNRRSQGGR
jgi:hypothetical protein